ncbi:T9SS type A sorting domain-containing protein [Pontimicrobium sp. SW4]|uniref:T9SS type A sorting domain-containing protein n=1 Tax=Pontimicrobium sp. SW4 TaxID=3153519 RepID=A0AAU7BVC5_9FLAO
MKPKILTLALVLVLFSAMAINAQDSNETAFLETTSEFYASSTVTFNPSGIGINVTDNTLSLYFLNRMAHLRYEVINKKGEVLLLKKAKSTQQSSLDISSLKNGTYFVRVYNGTLKDFLKFHKK